MARTSPELIDYIAFFEVAPDPPVDAETWFWETLVFRTVRDGVAVRCEIGPGGHQVVVLVQDGERLVVDVDVELVESIRLEVRGLREVMIVRSLGQACSLVLALRPALHVAWAVDRGE